MRVQKGSVLPRSLFYPLPDAGERVIAKSPEPADIYHPLPKLADKFKTS